MIKNQLYLIGALTSKPYAFTARSWELKNIDSLDIFDSTGSNIKISTRGSSVLRILPKVNENINEEWITDKARFSYDAFKFQRILYNYTKSINGIFFKINWPKIFSLLKQKKTNFEFLKFSVKKINLTLNLNFFVGSFSDLETLNFIKKFEFLTKAKNVSVLNSSLPKINFDFRSKFIFEDTNLNNLHSIIFIGSNPRLEAPAFNLKVRKQVIFNNLKVFNVGFNTFLTYRSQNLGTTIKKLIDLLEGRFYVNKFLKKKYSIIFGISFFQKENGIFLYNYAKGYLDANILFSEASSINFFEIGFPINSFWSSSKNNLSINWLLDEDKSIFLKKNIYNIYAGHHGDLNFQNSNTILPITLFSEKNSTYINYQGFIQKTKFVDSSLLNSDVRDDLVFMKTFLSQNSRDQSFKNQKLFPYTPKKVSNHYQNFFVNNNSIHYYMKDFYRNDSISRNSPIMALTSSKFNFKKSSFKK